MSGGRGKTIGDFKQALYLHRPFLHFLLAHFGNMMRHKEILRQDPLDLSFWSFFNSSAPCYRRCREASSVKIY